MKYRTTQLAPRSPTPSEKAFIADVLRRIREHFREWPRYEEREHNLVAFAYYEGCGGSDHCGQILAEAAPLALGQELVLRHGFEWVMIAGNNSGNSWRYGVTHPALNEPIDLVSLEYGAWNREEYSTPPSPGVVTHDSLETILAQVESFSGSSE